MRKLLMVPLMLFLTVTSIYADELLDGRDAYGRQNYKKALEKLTPLAEQGNPEAQFHLGLMFAMGRGVVQDYVQAHKWYNLSASNSKGKPHDYSIFLEDTTGKRLTSAQVHYISTSNIKAIEKEMTPAQIWEARTLAREWSPKPPQ